MITIYIILNFIVGIFIGISGIAGFLLPMFYVGFLSLPIADSMSLSFGAFCVSGIIGTILYYKKGDIDFEFASKLMIGSIIGSLIGVWANGIVDIRTAKIVLYVMVFVSSISLLFSKKSGKKNQKLVDFFKSRIVIMFVGALIAAISSFSGAGGPILSVPLFSLLGFSIGQAVGISLFNSIFIAIPAYIGYFTKSDLSSMLLIMIISFVSHGLGTVIGASFSKKINQKVLKFAIILFSVACSLYMLNSVIFI